MKTFMVGVLALLLIGSGAMAGDKAKAADGKSALKMVQMDRMNNVVVMTADGERTAICGCGKEFAVTPAHDQLVIVRGNETDYCCTEGCHAMLSNMPAEKVDLMMAEYWAKFPYERTYNTAVVKDGKTTATCFCGNENAVTDQSPIVLENGVRLYPCSDACATGFHYLSAADRQAIERKFVQAAHR